MSMLRLFAKRGVRLAPFHTAHQHPSRRTFYTGEVVKSPELSEDQIGAPGNAKPDWLCCRGSENHLLERVEKMDDRVAGLAKDLGNFERAMEKGFGEVIAAIETSRGDIKAQLGDIKVEIRLIVWQVFLVGTYLAEYNIFTKKQPSATPPISRGPTQVVSSGPAGVPTLG